MILILIWWEHMVRQPQSQAQSGTTEQLLEAAIVIGGIALGLLLLKRLTEGHDDEE
jgi:hypothetical protein